MENSRERVKMTKFFTHLIALVRLFADSSEDELAGRISFIMIIHGFIVVMLDA